MRSKGCEENESRSGTRLVSGPFIGACRQRCTGSSATGSAVVQTIADLGRRPRGHRPSPRGGVRRTRESDAKASNSSHFPAGYHAIPSDFRFHRRNQLLCRTADSRRQHASIADMGCALFGIECLTLSGASLDGWIANRCLRATAARYGAGIAFLLLRLPSDALAVITRCSPSARMQAGSQPARHDGTDEATITAAQRAGCALLNRGTTPSIGGAACGTTVAKPAPTSRARP